jgi:hypothetical protein
MSTTGGSGNNQARQNVEEIRQRNQIISDSKDGNGDDDGAFDQDQ